MRCTRRRWLLTAAAAGLSACAAVPGDGSFDRILDTATGQALTTDDVLRKMRAADIVLLGELHDNRHHHARRAALIAGLGQPASVVVEHLPQGAEPVLSTGMASDTLRLVLEGSGFDVKGWRWPLHEPLFAAIARAGIPLRGGNLPRDAARKVAREGVGALPADMATWIDSAPLSASARAALEQDLALGHCGHLSAARTPGMVAAQRGRDAAMAQALLAELARVKSVADHRPVILLAGNGHVRVDYGVPTLLKNRLADARVLTVGFVEPSSSVLSTRPPFDIVWTTPPAARDDPCKAFAAPAPAPTPAPATAPAPARAASA